MSRRCNRGDPLSSSVLLTFIDEHKAPEGRLCDPVWCLILCVPELFGHTITHSPLVSLNIQMRKEITASVNVFTSLCCADA